jgi:hypothetical protein
MIVIWVHPLWEWICRSLRGSNGPEMAIILLGRVPTFRIWEYGLVWCGWLWHVLCDNRITIVRICSVEKINRSRRRSSNRWQMVMILVTLWWYLLQARNHLLEWVQRRWLVIHLKALTTTSTSSASSCLFCMIFWWLYIVNHKGLSPLVWKMLVNGLNLIDRLWPRSTIASRSILSITKMLFGG